MTSEITYAEVKFKNESNFSGTKSEPRAAPKESTSLHKSNLVFSKVFFSSLLLLLLLLAILFLIVFIIFFQKYSQLLKEKKTIKESNHTALECMKNLTIKENNWSCCPKNWKSFHSNCYFISTETKNWTESEKNCSGMEAHLLVINTKAEENFITQSLDHMHAYYVGLSDLNGTGDWQWVDKTPYNESAAFWHQNEPNNHNDRCVILNAPVKKWGWNDVGCKEQHRLICKMMKISLQMRQSP